MAESIISGAREITRDDITISNVSQNASVGFNRGWIIGNMALVSFGFSSTKTGDSWGTNTGLYRHEIDAEVRLFGILPRGGMGSGIGPSGPTSAQTLTSRLTRFRTIGPNSTLGSNTIWIMYIM